MEIVNFIFEGRRAAPIGHRAAMTPPAQPNCADHHLTFINRYDVVWKDKSGE
jgi:hypothetical protein